MNSFKKAFSLSFDAIKKDKWILLFSSIPTLIGFALYSLLGNWIYNQLLPNGRERINLYLQGGQWGEYIYYVLVTVLSICLLLFVNYTFFLVVSIFSAPFNDLISARVEKAILGKNKEEANDTWAEMVRNFLSTLWNEIKKIVFIFFLSCMAFILGLIPLLAPVGFLLSSLLISVSFLDYSWSRNKFGLRQCIKDIFRSLFPYTMNGIIFLLLLSVPIVNLLILPIAVIFTTSLFITRSEVV